MLLEHDLFRKPVQVPIGAYLRLARLSSSAKADDPVIAGRRETHRSGLESHLQGVTGCPLPAFAGTGFAGMTPEKLLKLAPMGSSPGQAFSGSCSKADPGSILRRPQTFLHLLPRAGAPSWIGRRRFPSQAAQLTGTPWRIEGLSALREGFAFGSTRGSQSNTFASSHRWTCRR